MIDLIELQLKNIFLSGNIPILFSVSGWATKINIQKPLTIEIQKKVKSRPINFIFSVFSLDSQILIESRLTILKEMFQIKVIFRNSRLVSMKKKVRMTCFIPASIDGKHPEDE